MDEKNVRLCVPAKAEFARTVRMTASALAVCCGMSVEGVEDIRMIAEEGFVYACATEPAEVEVAFSLGEESIAMDFSLGEGDPADDSIELVEVLLDAVCDEFFESEDGTTLHLLRRSDGKDGE
ncbi:MAG TPA: ATP-binding protein [Candidatus Olsenella pullicola]|nr:ATP-binding protein [Candidatus Olsenella pullicola]